MLEHEICQSRAWKKLTGSSVKLFIFLRSKAWGRFDIARTSTIKVSYSEMKQATGLAVQTVRKSIIQLENIGFIDFIEQGGLKSGGYSKNGYKLSIRYLKYNMFGFEKGKLKEEQNVMDRGFGAHKKWRHHNIITADKDLMTKVNAEGEGSEKQEEKRPKLNLRMVNS